MAALQLELFEPSALIQRGTHGQSPMELAGWILDHGVCRLTRPERAFLYEIFNGEWTISTDVSDEIYRLYRRVGKRQERKK